MELTLRSGQWTSGPVLVALGFVRRWRGLRPRTEGRGLVLGGRSAHTFGLREALWVIGLSATGVVNEIRFVAPGRMVVLSGAALLLELPATGPPPPLEAQLLVRLGDLPGRPETIAEFTTSRRVV